MLLFLKKSTNLKELEMTATHTEQIVTTGESQVGRVGAVSHRGLDRLTRAITTQQNYKQPATNAKPEWFDGGGLS
jgi:hypothetical protein